MRRGAAALRMVLLSDISNTSSFLRDGIFGEDNPPLMIVVSHDLVEMSMEIRFVQIAS